jgi:general secretion pathway protein F
LIGLTTVRTGFGDRIRRSTFDLTVFNQQLHTLLDAGQPVPEAIEVLRRHDRHGRYSAVFDSLLSSLRQGKQLSDAMQSVPSVFPQLFISMIRSSETTGTVKDALRRYLQHQHQAAGIRAKLVSAAIYPAILLAVGLLVIAFLMMYVVPRFSLVFEDVGTARHASAGFIQIWGGFVRNYPLIAWPIAFSIVAAIGVILLHPGMRGGALRRLMKTEWIGYRIWMLQLARLYRTLAMLLQSGISITGALKLSDETLPEPMRPNLRAVLSAVREGKPMSMAMPEHALATDVAQRLLLAGESSGSLGQMMEKIADFYDQETSAWIDTAGRLIEPILMIGIGLIVGLVVLMLYSPIFDLANAI